MAAARQEKSTRRAARELNLVETHDEHYSSAVLALTLVGGQVASAQCRESSRGQTLKVLLGCISRKVRKGIEMNEPRPESMSLRQIEDGQCIRRRVKPKSYIASGVVGLPQLLETRLGHGYF